MWTPTIIYPLFLDCQDFTLDDYWKDVFYNCACNKFPKRVRYDAKNNTIILKSSTAGGKTEMFNVPHEPEETFKVLMDVFREKLSMRSSKDLCIRKSELETIEKDNQVNLDCEWRQIKPRSIKDQILIEHIKTKIVEHKLSSSEVKQLWNTITLGFQFKKIDSGDVHYETGKILNINGLTFDMKSRKFSISNPSKIVNKVEKAPSSNRIYQAIDRYIREYKSKKIIP